MKHLWKFAFGVLALALASCNSDAPAPNNSNDADGDVYATLRVKLPSATPPVTPARNTDRTPRTM